MKTLIFYSSLTSIVSTPICKPDDLSKFPSRLRYLYLHTQSQEQENKQREKDCFPQVQTVCEPPKKGLM